MKKDGKKLNKKLVIGSVLIIIFLFQVVEIENLRFINISNGETIEDFVYIVDNQSNVTITKYQGNSTKVEIPETIDGKKVTGIGQSAFYNCESLVNIIDMDSPVINSVTGNATEWTNESVTLTINAKDDLSGLSEYAYSFNGGELWVKENKKTYTENEDGIIIQVRDNAGNITTSEKINITKIDTDSPIIEVKEEKDLGQNKLKVILTSNEEMTNISELNLLDNKNIEDWNLSEDKKELTITYVNNTEEDMKIVDKFIIKDHVQNESKVDLEKHNIIVEAKK